MASQTKPCRTQLFLYLLFHLIFVSLFLLTSYESLKLRIIKMNANFYNAFKAN